MTSWALSSILWNLSWRTDFSPIGLWLAIKPLEKCELSGSTLDLQRQNVHFYQGAWVICIHVWEVQFQTDSALESFDFFFFFFFFLPHCTPCRILVPWPGIEPIPPAVKSRSLNHWTGREVPEILCLFLFLTFSLALISILGKIARIVDLQRALLYLFVILLYFYFWLCWVFIAARFSSSCGAQTCHCSGFSCCGAWALGHRGFMWAQQLQL